MEYWIGSEPLLVYNSYKWLPPNKNKTQPWFSWRTVHYGNNILNFTQTQMTILSRFLVKTQKIMKVSREGDSRGDGVFLLCRVNTFTFHLIEQATITCLMKLMWGYISFKHVGDINIKKNTCQAYNGWVFLSLEHQVFYVILTVLNIYVDLTITFCVMNGLFFYHPQQPRYTNTPTL